MTLLQRLTPLAMILLMSITSSHAQVQTDQSGVSAEELSTWIAQAEEGDLTAQLHLGKLYYMAFDDTPRTQSTYDWWFKAARQGDARAQYLLALLYHQDAALGHDKIRAFAWLQLAAEQTLPEALSIRGEMARLLTPQQQREAQQLSRTLLTTEEEISAAVGAERSPVEVVPQPSHDAPAGGNNNQDSAPAPSTGHYVQVAAVMDEASANTAREQWQQRYGNQLSEGIAPFINLSIRNNGRQVYRLQLGPFDDSRSANAECERLKTQGQDCFVGRL